MLQTNAHNPNVKEKMTLDTFSGMLKFVMVNDTTPLEASYITKLYFSVTEYPLSVHQKAKKQSEMYNLPNHRDLIQNGTHEEIEETRKKDMQVTLHLLQAGLKVARPEESHGGPSREVARMIFEEYLWEGLFPKISLTLQTQSSNKIVLVGANCLIQLILISSDFEDLTIQREASINALIGFTRLFKE